MYERLNVPVIAYDRLIQSKYLNYYVSFDGVQVGRLQGEYIAEHYRQYQRAGAVNVFMVSGSQTDTNALLFSMGVVDASNIASTVIADKFISKSDVCNGIPVGTDGVC
jgi:ABC-type xylose transport system substrate-binding protein